MHNNQPVLVLKTLETSSQSFSFPFSPIFTGNPSKWDSPPTKTTSRWSLVNHLNLDNPNHLLSASMTLSQSISSPPFPSSLYSQHPSLFFLFAPASSLFPLLILTLSSSPSTSPLLQDPNCKGGSFAQARSSHWRRTTANSRSVSSISPLHGWSM